jgi:hypothetical protein
MWPFIKPISLIRYLFVCRVNRSLVRLPSTLSLELSRVLGTIIANRLPTQQARHWYKALAPWEQAGHSTPGRKKIKVVPETSWPIESVLFAYPGKMAYGQGELILWELKLMGEDADHGFFLEVILPAVEEASSTSDPQWHRQNELWGRFDIHSVYVTRGPHWEPVVKAGQLDLSYQATPVQWAEGLDFTERPHLRKDGTKRIFDRLTWITPFDLGKKDQVGRSHRRKKAAPAPTLHSLLEALISRMSELLPGKYSTADDVWKGLSEEERALLQGTMEQGARVPIRSQALRTAPKKWRGCRIGSQTFASIPHSFLPYLELASILHIGKKTHFGCGTFAITDSVRPRQ